jgi:hypothetical protein
MVDAEVLEAEVARSEETEVVLWAEQALKAVIIIVGHKQGKTAHVLEDWTRTILLKLRDIGRYDNRERVCGRSVDTECQVREGGTSPVARANVAVELTINF